MKKNVSKLWIISNGRKNITEPVVQLALDSKCWVKALLHLFIASYSFTFEVTIFISWFKKNWKISRSLIRHSYILNTIDKAANSFCDITEGMIWNTLVYKVKTD